MLFNSFDFFVFLPIVLVCYWLLAKSIKWQNVLLLIASYVFYGWWDWRFLSLIALSTIVDYFVGFKVYRSDDKIIKKRWLWVSVFFNIGLLGFFKYFNFFVGSWIELFASLGYTYQDVWTLSIVLPVGISFYTFQTMSYSIDIYRGKLEPTKDFVAFAAFVSFFPQLVAGPIERATNLVPQFLKPRTFTYDALSKGGKLMIWGFFLKLVVADRAAIYVNAVYNNIESHDGLSFIAATILFAFQIYGDFAGYSLIAIGTAKLFGFDLMTNFRRPYFAASVSEFWTRWHISLSTWFRDYLYIPLGGNRVSKPRWLYNLFITFLISGLWHGANWTFVAWGALNGVYLIAEALLFKKGRKGLHNVLLTFVLINLSWVFFRANSINNALSMISEMLTNPGRLYIGSGDDIAASLYATLAIAMLVLVETKKEYFNSLFTISNNRLELIRLVGYAIVVFMILYFGVFGESQFIYFQF
ncbi:MBOAT family O-acyltransferase [Aquimarina spongiae]|uniref:D-alanyl-lipoteichoic acid acyltransferase DltB, MBOAT superfamily n=1 Tax=Aquimarina spongiae TaxID=570521 RepID=A0A1M6AH23_9FLAO|nr:MBOAT family O-acyltransferase [Aquimarina spongiae]SHI35618.1 D-alanyl-lipoteichoic acid acyltransferase DltB, MBOAT superfamily [Aquimarina spongiae]